MGFLSTEVLHTAWNIRLVLEYNYIHCKYWNIHLGHFIMCLERAQTISILIHLFSLSFYGSAKCRNIENIDMNIFVR